MQWQVVVAMAVVIPVILFPAAFVWYVNIGGIMRALRQAKQPGLTRETQTETVPVKK